MEIQHKCEGKQGKHSPLALHRANNTSGFSIRQEKITTLLSTCENGEGGGAFFKPVLTTLMQLENMSRGFPLQLIAELQYTLQGKNLCTVRCHLKGTQNV